MTELHPLNKLMACVNHSKSN